MNQDRGYENMHQRTTSVRMQLAKAKLSAAHRGNGSNHANSNIFQSSTNAWHNSGHDRSFGGRLEPGHCKSSDSISSNSSFDGSETSSSSDNDSLGSTSSSESSDSRKRRKRSSKRRKQREREKGHKKDKHRRGRSKSKRRSERQMKKNKRKSRDKKRRRRHHSERHRRSSSRKRRDQMSTKRKFLSGTPSPSRGVSGVRNHIAEQQRAMTAVLNSFDEHLSETAEAKRQEDFERKLDEQLEKRNNLLLADLVKRGGFGFGLQQAHMAHIPRHQEIPSEHFNQIDSNIRAHRGSPAASPGQSPKASALGNNLQSPASPSHLAPKSEEPQNKLVDPAREIDTSSPSDKNDKFDAPEVPDVLKKPKGPKELKEDQNIWDQLMDDECDLLYISDDEEERLEKERQLQLAKLEKEKKKAKKVIVYGKGRPMYRWRKEGINEPPKDQVLKGKLLFRSIVFTLMAVSRMKRESLRKKESHLADEIADTEKGVVWFTDKTKSWLAQTLSLPLIDVVTKGDQVLDPKSLGMGLAGKLAFTGKWAAKMRGYKGKDSDATGQKKDDRANKLSVLALRLKVRVRGILELIIRSLDEDKPQLPVTNRTFYLKVATDGCVFPESFLFPTETSALSFSPLKHTRWMIPLKSSGTMANGGTALKQIDKEQLGASSNASITGAGADEGATARDANSEKYDLTRVKLILGNFIFNRCLLPLVLRPWEAGVGFKPERKQQNSLTMLATMLYVLLQEHMGGPLAGEGDPADIKKSTGLKLTGAITRGNMGGKDGGTHDDGNKASGNGKKSGGVGFLRRRKTVAKVGVEPEAEQVAPAAESSSPETPGTAEDATDHKEKLENEAQCEEQADGKSAGDADTVKMQHPTPYAVTTALFSQKHYAVLQEHLDFLPALSILFEVCLLKIIDKTFFTQDWEEDSEREYPGLREQLRDKIQKLQQTKLGDRRLVKARQAQLGKKLELLQEPATLQNRAMENGPDQVQEQEQEQVVDKREGKAKADTNVETSAAALSDDEKEPKGEKDGDESENESESESEIGSDGTDSDKNEVDGDLSATENKLGKEDENGQSGPQRLRRGSTASRMSAQSQVSQAKSQLSRRNSNVSQLSRARRDSVASSASRRSAASARSHSSRALDQSNDRLASERSVASDIKSVASHRSRASKVSTRSRASLKSQKSARRRVSNSREAPEAPRDSVAFQELPQADK